jgi:rare lipoprotein A
MASASRSTRRYRHVDASATAFINDGVDWSRPVETSSGGWHGSTQTGMASWYGGSRWHGHLTSSGERYDQEALTAAHATLPLGTLVRVSMIDGSGSIVVRITDRPGTRRRIIDLSQAAARELGILSRGIAMVRLEPI